jgi:hypothetical protein
MSLEVVVDEEWKPIYNVKFMDIYEIFLEKNTKIVQIEVTKNEKEKFFVFKTFAQFFNLYESIKEKYPEITQTLPYPTLGWFQYDNLEEKISEYQLLLAALVESELYSNFIETFFITLGNIFYLLLKNQYF